MIMKTLVDALPSIRKIAGQDLHAKTLYRVSLLLDRFDRELKAYDETREKLIEKYCDRKEGKVIPKPDRAAEFEREMRELLNMDVDMNGVQPVEIPAEEDVRISYTDLCLLGGLSRSNLRRRKKHETDLEYDPACVCRGRRVCRVVSRRL